MIDDYGIIDDRAPHIAADLAELICFFEKTPVSVSDVAQYIQAEGGDGLLAEMDLDTLDSASANEKFQLLAEEAFDHLRYRKIAFGRWYPFTIDSDVLDPPRTGGSQRQLVYSALLAYSRLKMFRQATKKGLVQKYAANFEKLCVVAATEFAPKFEVIHFGTNGQDRDQFGVKLADAVNELAKQIHADLDQGTVKEISDNDSGDAGIDIIILRNWNDPAPGMPIYFCQCAAQQKNWPNKKFESHPLGLHTYFNFFSSPGSIMFIPVCFRNPDGNWVSRKNCKDNIVIDRLRLVELLEARIARKNGRVNRALGAIEKPFAPGCAN